MCVFTFCVLPHNTRAPPRLCWLVLGGHTQTAPFLFLQLNRMALHHLQHSGVGAAFDDVGETARALGRTPADYITDSYRFLFLQHRDANGPAGPDMVFAGTPE